MPGKLRRERSFAGSHFTFGGDAVRWGWEFVVALGHRSASGCERIIMPDAKSQPKHDSTGKPVPLPDLTGRTLGDYQILRRLGVCGMGQVYLARQLSLKREIALKLLRSDLAANPTALKRFEAEAQAVARLNHPNIVHIHQIGEHDGLRYMALEYVEGRNLRDHLARKGPPELLIALSVMRQVTQALQNAHDQGIVHRDIKPENILVTRKVDVKVTDFGLSRFFAGEMPATNLTQSGLTLGTPLYMSPEQVQGLTVDQRSDIYSLGVTCYHLLSGEPPFRGATGFDVALKHVQEQPRPLRELCPDLPTDLCGMVHKMMAKEPVERYQSAREILRDLSRVRDGVALTLTGSEGKTQSLAIGGVNTQAISTLPAAPVVAHPVTPALPPHPAEVVTVAVIPSWFRWGAIGLGCVAAIAGGVLLATAVNPPAPTPVPRTTPSLESGLPDLRLSHKLVTTRERELLAVLASRETPPQDVINASIELGLLYLHEQRLDEAEARFKKLSSEQLPGSLMSSRTTVMAGRLGQAVVLAYRDQKEHTERSNAMFLNVINDPLVKLAGKFDKGASPLASFLVRHADLSHAIADALNRNAVALGKTKLEPPALEQLRSPPRANKRD